MGKTFNNKKEVTHFFIFVFLNETPKIAVTKATEEALNTNVNYFLLTLAKSLVILPMGKKISEMQKGLAFVS